MSELSGRRIDAFELPSGRVLTSGWLLDATYSFLLDVGADIAAFRLVQTTRSDVRILIVPGPQWSDAMSGAVERRFAELVGEPLTITVELVAELPRSAAGKHQPVVSQVRRQAV